MAQDLPSTPNSERKHNTIKLLALSDLHIGGKNDVKWMANDKVFVGYLKQRLTVYDQIVLVGDVIDLYDTACCCESKEQRLRSIVEDEHAELIEFIFAQIRASRIAMCEVTTTICESHLPSIESRPTTDHLAVQTHSR